MKVISCASYHGTGSSAITDFLSEFDNVYSMTNYEFRFVQDPDGISDLEYNLVENHNRHNSGHALKRFKRLTDFNAGTKFNKRYEPFFDNQYKKISYKYIDRLTDFTFKGYWFYDLYDKGTFYYYLTRLPEKIMSKLHGSPEDVVFTNPLPNEITYCSHPTEEQFLTYTKEYIDELLTIANKEHKPYLMVDQIVPPSNIQRFVRYFNDIKVIVVDRDPRDLYILTKYMWKDPVVPCESVDLFCKWFAYIREHRKTEVYDPKYAILVQFEDLIYKYDATTTRIMDWLGLTKEQHVSPKSGFDPAKSIKNTKLWISHPEYQKEAEEIAKKLPEYLYDYVE